MKILIQKDGEGYLACVRGAAHLFAYGLTRDQALQELSSVIDMTMDYHLEQVDVDRQAFRELLNTQIAYAI